MYPMKRKSIATKYLELTLTSRKEKLLNNGTSKNISLSVINNFQSYGTEKSNRKRLDSFIQWEKS